MAQHDTIVDPPAILPCVGRYRITHPVGRGGMGDVYAAYDPKLKRWVAIKLLTTATPAAPISRAEARARMVREARVAAQLRHPHIVAVHDAGEINGVPFIAMELVDGESIRAVAARPGVGLEHKVDWLRQLAEALAAAHAAGLVHRDIKPDNVMVDATGSIKLLDFGVAKRAARPGSEKAMEPATVLTKLGQVIGTPDYMSPEQRFGWDVDSRSDQYCFGILAWELLAGVHPITAGWELGHQLPIIGNGVPDAVEQLVRRAAALDPKARHESMAAIASKLAQIQNGVSTLEQDDTDDDVTRIWHPSPSRANATPRVAPTRTHASEPISPPCRSWHWARAALVAVGAILLGALPLTLTLAVPARPPVLQTGVVGPSAINPLVSNASTSPAHG